MPSMASVMSSELCMMSELLPGYRTVCGSDVQRDDPPSLFELVKSDSLVTFWFISLPKCAE